MGGLFHLGTFLTACNNCHKTLSTRLLLPCGSPPSIVQGSNTCGKSVNRFHKLIKMGSDISINVSIPREEVREIADSIKQEKERESSRLKEWEKHITSEERKSCVEYVDKFKTMLMNDPYNDFFTIDTDGRLATPMELACTTSAVTKKTGRPLISSSVDDGVMMIWLHYNS